MERSKKAFLCFFFVVESFFSEAPYNNKKKVLFQKKCFIS